MLSLFDSMGRQFGKEFAALFAFYGVNAPVTGDNIKNAIKVFGTPFSEKVESILKAENKACVKCRCAACQEESMFGSKLLQKAKTIGQGGQKQASQQNAPQPTNKTQIAIIISIAVLIVLALLLVLLKKK